MSEFLIFPARSSYVNIQHGVDKNSSRFEVYSSHELDVGEMLMMEKITIKRDRLLHYIVNMNINDLKEAIDRSGYYPGYGEFISSSVFSRINREIELPKIMGIANLTPDSFYPGSRIGDNFEERLDSVINQKPEIIDIGGESTRPGSEAISPEKEIERIGPALRYIKEVTDIPVSIDSRNPETISHFLDLGIDYINDISGFSDPRMTEIAAANNLKCIAMHMVGTPKDMQNYTSYDDMFFEMNSYFYDRTSAMIEAGVNPDNIIIDPGIGFSKDLEGNLGILNNLQSFNLGFGTLVGASRKGFIGKITGADVENRLSGTIATSIFSMTKKTDIIRVHDVAENRKALLVYKSILDEKQK